jgi:hypothetical protein
MSKKRKPSRRREWWLVIFYLTWLLVGTAVGIWVNDVFYAKEGRETNFPQKE